MATIISGSDKNQIPEYLIVTHKQKLVTITIAKKLPGPPVWNSETIAQIIVTQDEADELKRAL